MINEQDKKEVVKLIVEWNITRRETKYWNNEYRWLDQNGHIWASTDECWKIVERMKGSISEEDKIAISKNIIQYGHAQEEWYNNDNYWDTSERYCDPEGNIWAKTEECKQYVERLKKLKVML